jgi:hypothetical protein
VQRSPVQGKKEPHHRQRAGLAQQRHPVAARDVVRCRKDPAAADLGFRPTTRGIGQGRCAIGDFLVRSELVDCVLATFEKETMPNFYDHDLK